MDLSFLDKGLKNARLIPSFHCPNAQQFELLKAHNLALESSQAKPEFKLAVPNTVGRPKATHDVVDRLDRVA